MTHPPFRRVVETIHCDNIIRLERLSCGHTKTTLTATRRPAQRRRCLKCDLPADPNELLSNEDRQQMNADLAAMARLRRQVEAEGRDIPMH